MGQPGRGGAHGAPAGQVEMTPPRGRAERGGASTQRWERQLSEAEAGPVQDGDGGHDLSGSRFLLVYEYERVGDRGMLASCCW